MLPTFTRIALLLSFLSGLQPSWAQEMIASIEFTKEGTGYVSQSGEGYYEDMQGNYYLDGCDDDIMIIRLNSSGHFALVSHNAIITTTIDGVQQKVESNGSEYLRVRLLDILNVYPQIQDRKDFTMYESLILNHISQREVIKELQWNTGLDDTLAICTRTPYSPPTSILYVTANSTHSSSITEEFCFKINGVYSKKLNTTTLKDGDVVQLCKPKGVDALHFPACSKETSDTLFSQEVKVKLINTEGRLGTQLTATYELCQGDTVLLSQFYSQCIGYYMKDRETIPTTLWVEPNPNYYHPYKQARITVPGTYYLVQTPMLGCGEDYYNCPATSKNLVVKEKVNCMVTQLSSESMEKVRPLYYPNPTEAELTIQTEKDGTWELLNLQGQVLESREISAGIHPLQVAEFPAGVYLCRFRMGEKVFYQKVTKAQ